MRVLLQARSLYIAIAAILIILALGMMLRVLFTKEAPLVTSTVTRGDVLRIVPVSGSIQSESTALLSFAANGIIEEVLVSEGDVVEIGKVLATQDISELRAEESEAVALLQIAEADRDELLAGPRSEERDVTADIVEQAEADLLRTINEENEKVVQAKRTLLSSDIEALPNDAANPDTPPTISGTYTCDAGGIYTFETYPSAARSGYSYTLSGLETGTASAETGSPSALGTCGLAIVFADDVSYGKELWSVAVPNTRAASYAVNLANLERAERDRASKVAEAEETLDAALKDAVLQNASPRDEALRRANATVMQASARLAGIRARIEDRTLRAPFQGTITSVDMTTGEAAQSSATITIVGDHTHTLTARIPEIDIADIAEGQVAEVLFDARSTEIVYGTVDFISPLATEIDGVAYFEAKIGFETPPTWLRSGLNADVDIIVAKEANVLRIPKRFVTVRDGLYFVQTRSGESLTETPITIIFEGNDGYIAITGLAEGDTVVAP